MNIDNNQPYLRPHKRVALRHVEDSLEDRTGRLFVKEFNNATIIPRGQIVNIQKFKNENTVIDDIDYCSDIIPSETKANDITILYGGYFRHQWGHFLLNTTARLWWLVESEKNLDLIDKIVFISTPGESDKIDGNYKEFFQLLGIYEKIEVIDSPKSYSKIIVPDISFEHDVFYAKEMIQVFEKLKENCSVNDIPDDYKNYKKIFLTRSQLNGAGNKEFNLVYFDKFWEDNGFRVIAPEKLSLRHLISIFNQAETIVSVSGSTAHNLIFAPRETSLIIMERVAPINYFQIGISKMLEQDVIYIDSFLYPLVPIPTGNVFYYYPTQLFNKYSNDNNLKYFDNKDLIKLSRFKTIFKFFSSYKKQSGHYWGLSDNEYDLKSIEETYSETANIYEEVMKSRNYLRFRIKKFLTQLKNKIKN